MRSADGSARGLDEDVTRPSDDVTRPSDDVSRPSDDVTRPSHVSPLVVIGSTALISVALFAVAVALGWLGPDVGRGGGFCEAARDWVVRQPANTLSNLGFVVAGLAVGVHLARRGSGAMGASLATAYGVVVVLLGPGSAAMHATQSTLGGHLDLYSMYLLASFVLSYAISRLARLSPTGFAAVFVVALVVCTVAEFSQVHVPVVMTAGNTVFAAMLVITLVIELILRCRPTERLSLGWGVAAVVTLLLAFVIWNLGKDGGALCEPHSLLQPHAVWHAMDAMAAWFLYRYWATMSR